MLDLRTSQIAMFSSGPYNRKPTQLNYEERTGQMGVFGIKLTRNHDSHSKSAKFPRGGHGAQKGE